MKYPVENGDADDRTVVERRNPLLGTVVDERFRIDFQLAAGGFGAIYRATDVRSGAEVALKVLHPRHERDPMAVARFRREAATLAALRDPHTVSAYQLGEARDGTLYLVMELLHGESLYERFRAHGPLPWRRVVHIARGVCSSLAEAHARGIIHRDLKPANLHVEHRGDDPDFVKVLDFGIAKIVEAGEHDHSDLTQAGQMVGTTEYMSPEQIVGGEVTARSDIYTLGVVMYEMICGCTPFPDAKTATAILAAGLTRRPEPMSRRAAVPPTLDHIVARCLEREPHLRFAEISELGDALAEVAGWGAARASSGAAANRHAAEPQGELEPTVPTGVETRVDVRVTDLSRPVLDARGPRYRPVGPPPTVPWGQSGPVAAPVAPATAARGSQPVIEPRWPGRPDAPQAGPARRGRAHPVASYDMTAAASHDAMVRRIIWIAVCLVAAIVALAVTR